MTKSSHFTNTNNSLAKVKLYDLHPPLDDFRTEVIKGLQKPQKAMSAKLLYDKRGSELFDAICTLDEYYLTRTEMAILKTNAQEIASLIGDGILVEFGSGSSQKIRIILDAISSRSVSQPAQCLARSEIAELPTYVALDISIQHLYQGKRILFLKGRRGEDFSVQVRF